MERETAQLDKILQWVVQTAKDWLRMLMCVTTTS